MPATVLPKIVVTSPTKNRLRPQVASSVSIMRPYRTRMIRRSAMTPMMPTTIGATTSIAIQMLTPRVGGHDGGVAAEHEELAVGEVDHAHHAEDDGEPDADEHEAGDAVQDFERENGREVHRARTIDPRRGAGKKGAACPPFEQVSCVLTLRIGED